MAPLLRSCGLLLFWFATQANAVRVEDFGAVGDGVTFDGAAIQRAIAAAGPGGTVEFTAGRTYLQCRYLFPLEGQTFVGNGAVLQRCDAPLAALLADAQPGDTSIEVDRPEVFLVNQYVTPVKGNGSFADGESLTHHRLVEKTGNTLTFINGLAQAYPAGTLVTAAFDQFGMQATAQNVTIVDLVFDGNRQGNHAYVSWTRNQAVVTTHGYTVRNSEFRNLPGNGIMTFGTSVLIDGNRFEDLDGAIIHLSGNDPVGDSTVTISNNTARRTNQDATRMMHTEGVITVSTKNNSIRIVDNHISDADVPFVANMHENMGDWVVSNNVVFDTAGIFWARNSIGAPLERIEFSDNLFVNVGQSVTLRAPVGDRIRSFVFRDNQVIGGNLKFAGLADATIVGNTIKSCDTPPLELTDSTNARVERNVLTDSYCVLSLAAHGLIDERNGDVSYQIDVLNAADAADIGAVNGVLVTSLALANTAQTPQCNPALPATIALGKSLRCSIFLPGAASGGQAAPQVFSARGTTSRGNSVVSHASATMSVRDTTPPTITLLGADSLDLEFGDAYVELGATAADDRDGDISSAITINTNLDERRPGVYQVTYHVSDAGGNTAQANRTIRIMDRQPPILALLGPNPQSMFAGAAYIEQGATAIDNADGDLSAAIRIDVSGLDTSSPGAYVVRYDVQDSSGNAPQTVTRTVIVNPRKSGGGGAFGFEVLLLLLLLGLVHTHRCRALAAGRAC